HQVDILGTDLVAAPGVATDFAVNGVARDSIGQINYAFYQINDMLKAGVRQEWYKADSVSYNTITYGVNIKPTNNLLIRPEVRHMFSPANNTVYTGVGGNRAESLYNQTVFGVDAILTY
ncbi:MAG: outer membrane beta-barrel protein, partial [Planctomycetaceae bacterium]|nr:outer membrane beta-barrel protein [Planctomycetaceae bacterium]